MRRRLSRKSRTNSVAAARSALLDTSTAAAAAAQDEDEDSQCTSREVFCVSQEGLNRVWTTKRNDDGLSSSRDRIG